MKLAGVIDCFEDIEFVANYTYYNLNGFLDFKLKLWGFPTQKF